MTYAFQSEFTLYSCPNVKKLPVRNRCDIWSLSDSNGTRIHNHLVRKRTTNHLAKLAKYNWSELWVLICTVHLAVCYYHVTYTFQGESTLYSRLNVKKLLARNRRNIWSLSDSNGTRTYNNLVCKRTLNHLAELAKWLDCIVSTYLCGAFDCLLLSCQATIKCRSTLKLSDLIITYTQMRRTGNYSQHSSIIWPVWLYGWVFVYKLSGCGFESRCFHLNFRYGPCFEQRVPWHSDKL